MLSGSCDGLDEGISALVHLASLKFMTLRPVMGVTFSESLSSFKVRVEILKSVFDGCESLLDNTRQLWKRSMMNFMAWLRPEVMTSEVKYEISKLMNMEVDLYPVTEDETFRPRKRARFDVVGFYEAIKPSNYVLTSYFWFNSGMKSVVYVLCRENSMLEDEILNLLHVLRSYQCLAAYLGGTMREGGFKKSG
ncbi:hypothetical protein CRYUN_Cryun05aG0129300 [Craigia yunnanensis]